MIHVKIKQKHKSKIAVRFRYMNIILLALILLLMTATAGVIINRKSREAAMNLVNACSIEAAEKFYAYISEDLALVRELARSKAMVSWFADEGNGGKKAGACDMMMDYMNMQENVSLYLGVSAAMNEYSIRDRTELADLKPYDRLNPSNKNDAWYFECAGSKNDYTFNIDNDKASGIWRLWINHKVITDGKLTGVFCSGLLIPDIFRNIFANYGEKKISGYFINSRGIIQSASNDSGIYTQGNDNHIREESTDPAFAEALSAYEGRIGGFFGPDSLPEIVKLSGGLHGYAAIKPVQNTDWSVVVFNNSYPLAGVTDFVPFLIAILAGLLVYVTGRNFITYRLILTPLAHLTRSVSENKSAAAGYFGSEREDEIGDLARTIRDATLARQRQEKLLHAVNSATSVLLATMDGKKFEASLVEGMNLMGLCVDIDRIHIWKNEETDGVLYYVKQYEWVNNIGQQKKIVQPRERFPLGDSPEWKIKFLRDECINGPLSSLTPHDREMLEPYGIRSILIIPVNLEGHFWGFVSFDDCHSERFFAKDEINILRSASLMMVSAVNHNSLVANIQDEHERIKLLMNATPHACRLWNRNYEIFECNDECIRLFRVRDRQEYVERYFDLSPEYQSDGQNSREKTYKILEKAFSEGRCVFEWLHQRLDGTPIPVEVTLVRVKYGDEFVLAGYTRDLREQKRMLNEIERRDNMLNTINQVAAILLQPEAGEFENKLQQCMSMIGRTVGADRITIWKNSAREGKLYCTQVNEWVGNKLLPTDSGISTDVPYEENIPTWDKILSNGNCINSLTRDLSQVEQKRMAMHGILSVFAAPVFVHDEFWGFVGCGNCRSETLFTEDETSILRSGSLLIANALYRNAQTEQLHEVHQHTQLLLDAMPFACNLWDKNYNIFGCNEENVRLFGLGDKQEYIERFEDLSPEYQPDGRPSSEGNELVKKAFEEGKYVFEWMHQKLDGTPIPAEVTLVRVAYDNDYVVAGYVRDLREHKIMMEEIERTANLLGIVNQVATILLQSDINIFESNLQKCMGMMGEAVGSDRITIWKNHTRDNRLYCTQVTEWLCSTCALTEDGKTVEVSYDDNIPGWKEILSQDKCISSLVRTLSTEERSQMAPWGILYLFVAPIFMHNHFWGYVAFDICKNERMFTESEQSILHSGSMLIATALLRNEMTLNIHSTAAKLEAVIANYPGIIWCVDTENMITLFNGQYLSELGYAPGSFEGRKCDDVLNDKRFTGICVTAHKTFTEGSQDYNSGVDDKMYRIRSMPIYGETGSITNVMGSFDDVTERTRLQAELKAALDEAQEANLAKSKFLANMSHEMRTPLNAIIGLSELTLGSEDLHGECLANLEKISNAGMMLLSTVNDILDISKIEAGKFALVPVVYDTPSLLNDAITQSIMRIGSKPIQFGLDIDENLPTRLYGDDLRIKQIINNLLSNAFKYTREGTVELKVTCERAGETVWITAKVSDTGIGIQSKDLGNLFTDYNKIELDSTRKIEGTGLGLSITKRLVELMDGSITVESEYGKGSVFTIKIRQKFVTDNIIGVDVVNSLKKFNYADQKRRRNFQMIRVSMPYARVLVVDDVVTNLDVARGMMKPYGMQIDCVVSGQEAIDAIRNEKVKYNAVFMDHMMPEMDGIEATRIIREEIGTEYAKTVPIIALTANAIVGNENMFLSNGFQAFISKPIEIERLDSVLREWVRDKEQEKTYEKDSENGEGLSVVRSKKDRRSVADRRSGVDRRTFGKKVSGIDYDRGVDRFGGDEDSYLQVLYSYANNTKPLLEAMKNVDESNLAEYAITVHGLKGSSRGICAEQIGARANALEEAAKEGNYDFVTANNATFIDAVEKLVAALDDMFIKIDAESSKPKKDMPDSDVLRRLFTACERYDMDGVDAAMAEIEGFEYEADDGLVAWIQKNVEQMNLRQIREKISDLGVR